MMNPDETTDLPPITELTKSQRRVLGALVEKALTTPDAYPMTLKALTTACNQKNNRSPVTNYREDDVMQTLDELRELGLVAMLHTDTGRTERYRHYMRQRFALSEPQLAILTELLLRGRQQVGELRSRASRMRPIDSLEQLREALQGLQEMSLVQASGPLERRGVEVDHNLYRPSEGQTLEAAADEAPLRSRPIVAAASETADDEAEAAGLSASSSTLRDELEKLRLHSRELRDEVDALKSHVADLSRQIEEIRRDLGG